MTHLLKAPSGAITPAWFSDPGVDDYRWRQVAAELANLAGRSRLYSMTIDLPSIAAGATQNVDVVASVAIGMADRVGFLGANLPHGLVVQGVLPPPAADTIRLRVSNLTAGAIDPVAMTFDFLIHRPSS